MSHGTLQQHFWMAIWILVITPIISTLTEAVELKALPVCLALNLIVFVAYLFRFGWGNHNYLEHTNAEGHKCPRLVWDSALLVLHGTAFFLMALSIKSVERFAVALIMLNLSDLTWWLYEERSQPTLLRIVIFACRNAGPNQRQPTFPKNIWKPYAPRTWCRNNLITAILLAGALWFDSPTGCYVMTLATTVIGLVNSAADIRETKLWFIEPLR